MANFFKDYHAEVKAKREAEESAKAKPIEYHRGQTVFINPAYDEDRNGKRFFADDLGNGLALLAMVWHFWQWSGTSGKDQERSNER